MRAIGHLDKESSARLLGDYLYVQGMDNEVEPDGDGRWTLWIHDEDHLDRATGILEEFRQDPLATKFLESKAKAEKRRSEAEKAEKEAAKRQLDSRDLRGRRSAFGGIPPVTGWLIGISVLLTLLYFVPGVGGLIERVFKISIYVNTAMLPEVRHGQIWRLFTPIFLHGGALHIFFNMWWLKDLGGAIENRFGSRYFLMMVGVIALLSNVAQYAFFGPNFVGMSGVVFGLLGFIWIRSQVDPRCGLFLSQTAVLIMGIWFFLCLFDIIPNVANMVHAVGLAVGVGWGWISGIRASRA